jgi:CheY-like chemotaxis protein
MISSKGHLLRILIVDDNEDAANSLGILLELDGHTTACVYAAVEALELASTFKPDVVLLDIGLPGMDGYEVALQIRELPGLKDVRLIAVTGYGRLEDRQRARDAGFDEHLVKPLDFKLLARILVGIRVT